MSSTAGEETALWLMRRANPHELSLFGAAGRSRTDTLFMARDFESRMSVTYGAGGGT